MAKQKTKKTDNITEDCWWDSDFPSTITDNYWVYAFVKQQQNHPKKFNTHKSGKWLVFADIKEIDTTWQIIKKATECGLLGVSAKAATAKPNENAASNNEKVICVYTYNWQDVDDVYRVEKALRSIGIEETLYYKTDSDTHEGKYKVRGSQRISKYISKATRSYRRHGLASLHGIQDRKVKILKSIGIKNFDDLLSFDTSQKLQGVGVSTAYINKIKLLALSQVENKIFQLAPIQFPDSDIIHFDIETDLDYSYQDKKVWSIAVHHNHHNNEVKHFYAEKWSQEKNILKEFLKYININKDAHFFSYFGFDKSVLKFAFARHKLDVDFFLSRNHYDLCALIKQHYVFPLSSYGLKHVGKYLGYKFKSEHIDGLYAAMRYIHSQESEQKLPKEIFHYIEDDVKVMHHIIEQLRTRKDIKIIFEHQTDSDRATASNIGLSQAGV
ncbi:MAG TPA: DUF1917 domain-containing protein [Saprospiraceae bacterium]|nr:DUF1917 domain-containing protein [Saprospiraceae bacterium]HMP15194.1 DUF1917 domain-containing protein [Saprospiraceae bacterium]